MSLPFKITLSLVTLLWISMFTAVPVAAHGGGEGNLWHHWAWQDLPLLFLIGGIYALGLFSLWAKAGTGAGISRARAGAFGVGWSVLFIALVSPLDLLSDQLFSAHMVQHLLLMLVAAPLFVIGRFPLALSWAFPARWTSKTWNEWQWKQAWNFLTRPATACLLHIGVIWFWHMPQPYEAAIVNEWLHFLEHISFFLTAFLFWQVFADLTDSLRAGGPAKPGLGIFYVFVIMLASGFLGVLITFSPHVWYPLHIHEVDVYGLTALEDQQLAGTIMWVPAGVIYVAAAIGVLSRWLFAMEAVENPQT
jgi:cytochrome c oxidase assembly factor CtaG